MDVDRGVKLAQSFFNTNNSGSYDGLVKLATLGQDINWKKKIVQSVPTGSLVLELACGTGILTSLLKKNNNTVYGIDLTFEYLCVLGEKMIEIDSINGTAEFLPFQSRYFDCIVASYLPKYVNLNTLVRECQRVLKQNGLLILHDFTYPRKLAYQFVWKIYFKIIQALWKHDRKWTNVFDGLDKLIVENHWDLKLNPILTSHGFVQIRKEFQTFETSAIISALKDEG
ncbi:putative menaquinone biosynthesis methyltransferase UbiE [Candidatus Nitrosocosmicus arcticus]|uniref:Putative menaquinone biosynthesis methyltransferase UbiE n=1 Tax=Candidatus Nitrosocosmicus arcticus TaxID=2035267 RepID=A0A557SYS7_9ARCH|nr:putative menaquinone biosynthesis methyltransferase UbiE [Candidatus Nitrosocosmicus arcticus]